MTNKIYLKSIAQHDSLQILMTMSQEQYPYCALLPILHAEFDTENIAKLAVLVPERNRLYDIVNNFQNLLVSENAKFEENTIDKNQNVNLTPISEKNSTAICSAEEILQQRLQELNQENVNNSAILAQNTQSEIPLEQDEYSENEEVVNTSNISVDELIENLKSIPPFLPADSEDYDEEVQSYKDLAKGSLMERTNIVSETLANLYYEQQLYDKAIKIYEALKAKYPEKSVIFANRIDEIKFKKKNK